MSGRANELFSGQLQSLKSSRRLYSSCIGNILTRRYLIRSSINSHWISVGQSVAKSRINADNSFNQCHYLHSWNHHCVCQQNGWQERLVHSHFIRNFHLLTEGFIPALSILRGYARHSVVSWLSFIASLLRNDRSRSSQSTSFNCIFIVGGLRTASCGVVIILLLWTLSVRQQPLRPLTVKSFSSAELIDTRCQTLLVFSGFPTKCESHDLHQLLKATKLPTIAINEFTHGASQPSPRRDFVQLRSVWICPSWKSWVTALTSQYCEAPLNGPLHNPSPRAVPLVGR